MFQPLAHIPRLALNALAVLLSLSATSALAKDGTDAWLEVNTRAVHSSRSVVESEAIERTGIGAGAEAGFEWRQGRTAVQFDLGASVFDYKDENRPTRTSGSGSVTVTQGLSDTLSVAVSAGHAENISTLEARETDQDAVRLEVQYEDKQNRLRLRAQYREREYQAATHQTGDGMRYDLQYNRRFGAWHWARVELQYDDIDSQSLRRGYDRYGVTGSYSLPIARNLRFRPEIEYRYWKFDHRTVFDDPALARRHDSYIAPEVGLAYGDTEGFSARARAAYQFRSSNDPRYRDNAPYFDLSLNYRF